MNTKNQRSLLIVDDDLILLDAFTGALEGEFHVVSATTVDEGWRFVEQGVDVVICDLHLKEESGMTLLRRACTARKIPRIIAMSGVATPADAFALAGVGALLFLEKPFSFSELRHAIDVVSHHSPRLEAIVAAHLGMFTLSQVEDGVRHTMVSQALAVSHGNQESAARMLGLTRQRVNQIVRGKARSARAARIGGA